MVSHTISVWGYTWLGNRAIGAASLDTLAGQLPRWLDNWQYCHPIGWTTTPLAGQLAVQPPHWLDNYPIGWLACIL